MQNEEAVSGGGGGCETAGGEVLQGILVGGRAVFRSDARRLASWPGQDGVRVGPARVMRKVGTGRASRQTPFGTGADERRRSWFCVCSDWQTRPNLCQLLRTLVAEGVIVAEGGSAREGEIPPTREDVVSAGNGVFPYHQEALLWSGMQWAWSRVSSAPFLHRRAGV